MTNNSIVKYFFLVYSLLATIGLAISIHVLFAPIDKTILDVAEHSYFTGCTIAAPSVTCHRLAKQYREDLRDHAGLDDLDSAE